jgi:arylsulfatase A-like enzyme
MLGLLGVPYEDMDGADCSRVFADPEVPENDSVYMMEYIPCHQSYDRGIPEWRAVRDQRFLYAATPAYPQTLLFDLEKDPLQLHNLAEDPAFQSTKERMALLLDRWIAKNDAFLPWEELVHRYGLTDEWNRSQAYFGLPLLTTDHT